MLFDLKEIASSTPSKQRNGAASIRAEGDVSPRLLPSVTSLRETIGQLASGQIIPFMTHGAWSLHQLLEYVLLQTGPAKVNFTTWTITEDPMRAVLSLIDRGLITELQAIFDYRIEKRKPEAFQFASQIVSNIKLTKCHAKVMAIENEGWTVTVIGSSNFSKNPRLEAGVIFTDEQTCRFTTEWITDEIQKP